MCIHVCISVCVCGGGGGGCLPLMLHMVFMFVDDNLLIEILQLEYI